MLIFYKNVYSPQEIARIDVQDVDLTVLNYHNPLCFNVTVGIPLAVKEAKRLSIYSDVPILMHAKMNIEGDNYLSTLFIERGEIAGVADTLSRTGFVTGGALRAYNIAKSKVGIVVDRDINYSCADILFAHGAKLIIHNSLSAFDREFFKAYKCHSYLHCGVYFGLFGDGAVLLDKTMRVLETEGRIKIKEVDHSYPVLKRMHNVTQG